MISDAFEGLAQSLRIMLEAVHRSQDLLFVDAYEAAGNIEQGLTSVLNSFHSVYDSTLANKEIEFDWYGAPETATILAIRNARHHNSANRIRGLYTFHLQQEVPENWKTYLIVGYPETEDGGTTFDAPISWYDLHSFLMLPPGENRLRRSASEMVLKYLAADKFSSYSAEYDIEEDAIFVNAVPLIVNAAKRLVPEIRSVLKPRSTEAKLFSEHFDHVFPADTQNHTVNKIRIFLPT